MKRYVEKSRRVQELRQAKAEATSQGNEGEAMLKMWRRQLRRTKDTEQRLNREQNEKKELCIKYEMTLSEPSLSQAQMEHAQQEMEHLESVIDHLQMELSSASSNDKLTVYTTSSPRRVVRPGSCSPRQFI
jgi:hypothetical protein